MIAFFPFIQPCSWNWDGNYAFTFPQLGCPCRHYGRWWNVPPPVCDNTTPVIMLLFECHPGRLDNVLIIFIAYQAVRKPGNIRYKSEPIPPPTPPHPPTPSPQRLEQNKDIRYVVFKQEFHRSEKSWRSDLFFERCFAKDAFCVPVWI